MSGIITKLCDPHNSTLPSITKCQDGHEWFSSFEFYPLAVGSRKSVFEGRMYIPNDYGSGTAAVVKTVNFGRGEESDIKAEVMCATKAQEYAKQFHRQYPYAKLDILVPCAAVLETVAVYNRLFRYLKNYSKVLEEGEYVLMERKLGSDFQNFTYKNGVVSSSCPDELQAFGHYTYVQSKGELVVSGLQGVGVNKCWTLSSPCVHSKSSKSRQFGKTDGGHEAINTFFSHHRCNPICKNWPKPSDNYVPDLTTVYPEQINCYVDTSFNNIQMHLPSYDGDTKPPPYDEQTQ